MGLVGEQDAARREPGRPSALHRRIARLPVSGQRVDRPAFGVDQSADLGATPKRPMR
ncbi:hypothetical protein GCM10017643_08750 [Ancylobacter dichloromethanicus]|uniref:Uncharacterized protein n=1 Tax=Ancylobacter dichloromethanicus TaxID=518825 RepID=A0A9W6J7P1_9HYPH|nr:hypothetical protein GCM10017643_08750 [Ancylobacter dichloromethanicus]